MTIKVIHQNNAAIIIIDRSHRYNATDLNTINALHTFLDDCLENKNLYRILLTSNHPKAFCAGGDIRAAYESIKTNTLNYAKEFFIKEYSLIERLSTFPKPIISIVNGMCFGGGMGLSMHNKYRIVTEKAILGMPETIIGFFPDVGASFKLAKLSPGWANFYGLMGYTIPIEIAIKADMVDYHINSDKISTLIDALCDCNQAEEKTVITSFLENHKTENTPHEHWVEHIFDQPLQEIFISLQEHAHKHKSAQNILNDLKSRSPLSLFVTYQLLKKARSLTLQQTLELDKVLAYNFLYHPDFLEGIRAQVIDKDKTPKWSYTSIQEVDKKTVDVFFTSR